MIGVNEETQFLEELSKNYVSPRKKKYGVFYVFIRIADIISYRHRQRKHQRMLKKMDKRNRKDMDRFYQAPKEPFQ